MCENCECKSDWHNILMNKSTHTILQIKSAYEYATFNFMELINYEKIYELDMETFMEITESDNLNVYGEEFVLDGTHKWIAKYEENPVYKKIFEAIRMPFLSPKRLLDDVYPLVLKDLASSKQFIDALRYHTLPEERMSIPEIQRKPRKIFRKYLSVASIDIKSSSVVELYDYSNNTWTFLKDFNLKKRNSGACIINDNLMIIGGYDTASVDSVEMINLKTGRISSTASLNEKRHNIGVAVLGTGDNAVVYVIGGRGNLEGLNTVEKWDPISKSWSFVKQMNNKRNYPGVTVMNDKIYVLAGRNVNYFHHTMEMYDPKSNIWEMKASMNHKRSYPMMTTAGNYIYAVGGYLENVDNVNGSKIVERYDPVKNTWMTLASISGYGIVGLSALGDKIIRAGGGGDSNEVEEYDPDKNQWRKLAPMTRGRDGAVLVEIPWTLFKCDFIWKN